MPVGHDSMNVSGQSEPDCESDRNGVDLRKDSLWPPLSWPDRFVILFAVAVIAAITVPRLPPGVCFDDSGDLQLTSATLTIAHPPGYATLVSLGWLLTRIPGIEPAYAVSLGCLASGIVAVALCMLFQVRLGVHPALAGAIGLGLAVQEDVWRNLLAPEVYAPGAAFLAGSTYLLFKHTRTGSSSSLHVAGLLFGLAVSVRPPVVIALPFFLVAYLLGVKSQNLSGRVVAKRVAVTTGCIILPGVYTLGFLWLRDTPSVPHNYIGQYNQEASVLPPADAGPGAKWKRVVWQVSGAQFRSSMGNHWRGVRTRLRWMWNELLPFNTVAAVLIAGLVVLGVALTARRCSPACWLLVGVAVHTVIFLCAYRIWGTAADMLPLIWAIAVFMGVALSPLVPAGADRKRRLVALVALAAVGAWCVASAPTRAQEGRIQDATRFVADADVATLPQGAIICSHWSKSTALWYATLVMTERDDIKVINAGAGRWLEMAAEDPERPVYLTVELSKLPDGYELTPYRNLWQLHRR